MPESEREATNYLCGCIDGHALGVRWTDSRAHTRDCKDQDKFFDTEEYRQLSAAALAMVSIRCSCRRDSIDWHMASPSPLWAPDINQHRYGLCVCRAHEISLHLCERTCAASCNAMKNKLSDTSIAESSVNYALCA